MPLQVVSTARKGVEYYEKLASLKSNQPFLQEVGDRRMDLIMRVAELDYNLPTYERDALFLKGQIAALSWVMHKLPNLKPEMSVSHKSKQG